MIIDVSGETFKKEVLSSKLPVIVDFWAEWCKPCKAFSPILEDLEREYAERVKFCKLNVDENEEVAATYNIMGIPAALIFDKGEVKAMSVGAKSKDAFRQWLESNL